jgi:hypothetical protein
VELGSWKAQTPNETIHATYIVADNSKLSAVARAKAVNLLENCRCARNTVARGNHLIRAKPSAQRAARSPSSRGEPLSLSFSQHHTPVNTHPAHHQHPRPVINYASFPSRPTSRRGNSRHSSSLTRRHSSVPHKHNRSNGRRDERARCCGCHQVDRGACAIYRCYCRAGCC